jgi:hypothetical protein
MVYACTMKTDYAGAAKKAAQPALSPPTHHVGPPTQEVARVPTSAAKSPGEKRPSFPAGSTPVAVSGTVVPPAAVAPPVVDSKESAMAAGSPQLSAAAAAASPPSTTASPAVGEPSVESFTFGSVVAPVVSSTDRAALHFGTSNAWGKPASAPSAITPAASVVPVVPAEKKFADAPSSSSSSPAAHSSQPGAPTLSPPATVKGCDGAAVEAHSQQGSAAKPAPADAGKTGAWGAKKSFADVSTPYHSVLSTDLAVTLGLWVHRSCSDRTKPDEGSVDTMAITDSVYSRFIHSDQLCTSCGGDRAAKFSSDVKHVELICVGSSSTVTLR